MSAVDITIIFSLVSLFILFVAFMLVKHVKPKRAVNHMDEYLKLHPMPTAPYVPPWRNPPAPASDVPPKQEQSMSENNQIALASTFGKEMMEVLKLPRNTRDITLSVKPGSAVEVVVTLHIEGRQINRLLRDYVADEARIREQRNG